MLFRSVGDNFYVVFDLVRGNIVNLVRNGKEIMHKGPRLTWWRAPISNDMELIDQMKKVDFLHLEHEIVKNIEYKEDGHFLCFTVSTVNGTTNNAWHFDTVYKYTVCPTGDILIEVSGTPYLPSGCPQSHAPAMLPRLGVSMHLDRSMEHVRYFGRGPGENYPDSKESGLMGVYENTIDGLFTNYVEIGRASCRERV